MIWDLIVFGWRAQDPRYVTHSRTAMGNVGRTDPDTCLRWGWVRIKLRNECCPVEYESRVLEVRPCHNQNAASLET